MEHHTLIYSNTPILTEPQYMLSIDVIGQVSESYEIVPMVLNSLLWQNSSHSTAPCTLNQKDRKHTICHMKMILFSPWEYFMKQALCGTYVILVLTSMHNAFIDMLWSTIMFGRDGREIIQENVWLQQIFASV